MISNTNRQKTAKYAMVIELDRCDGCGACQVACSVENNVPPPHPSATSRTGLGWVRVERVVKAGTKPVFVPVFCQQCGHDAPCASVCPQNAVEFDPATGVVGQVPQRCLGCRYCMAACPYHARVFNWHDPEWPAGMEVTLNPRVSPRMRGVVEKCNFCHGRWHDARQRAAAAEPPQSGPVTYMPACVEVCPKRAIHFGDLNDAESEFTRMAAGPECFRLLESLGTDPKVYYKSAKAEVRLALTSEVKA